MTDDPHTDDSGGGGDSSEQESTEDSRVDEFLQRFDGDQQPSERSPPSEADRPSDLSTGDADRPSDSSTSPSDSDRSPERKRLWDGFDSERTDDPREQPPESGDDRTDGDTAEDDRSGRDTAEDDRTDGDTAEFGTDEQRSPERTADSRATTADDPVGEGTAVGVETDPEPSGIGSAEPTEPTDTGSSTSFGSILERISHRIRGIDSESTAEPVDSDGPTGASTETGPRGTDESGSGTVTAESTHSDTIDEILNNIDLFGRATSSSQVLLLSPTAHSITNDIYARFLMPADGAGQNLLFVSATQSAGDQLAAAREIPRWREGKTGVIEVGRSALKPAGPGGGADVTTRLDVYKQISNLKHLAKLGINISHIVSQWTGSRRPTVVGVHTLSAVQQYVGNETMFQFLFTLKGQLNSMGVMGFYHMDPAAHTKSEIDTIQSAFDLVIEIGSDGSVDIL